MSKDSLDQLKTLLGEVYDLNSTLALMGWDQQTYMPGGGAGERGLAMATISRIMHLKIVSDEMQKCLAECESDSAGLADDSDEARLIKVTRREVNRRIRIPANWVASFAEATAVGQEMWEQAKGTSDFSRFQPYLERIIELRREYASFFQPYNHIYDPLLDEFEPGLKTRDVQAIFDVLRKDQIELIRELKSRPQVNSAFLHQFFPESAQWEFGVQVVTDMGFDWNRGRQDSSAHPFTTTFGMGDVRITTRLIPDNLASALFSTIHEGGHALYEQGFHANHFRSPLATGASMALHESQSRMWENLVGRSKNFWKHYYPGLQQRFPTQLGNVSLEQFYKGINRVEPTLIRTEADEATYNLHIMLRLELEIALLDRQVEVRDLPGIWRDRMQEYLGVVPKDDAHGVLQDIHWAGGLVGYFPTYALGNVISAQIWETINRDIPDLDEQISRGDFKPLLSWLRENIHVHGAKFETQELVKKVTGSTIDPQPYLSYLQTKFSEIYS
ncbi:MAG: carboxypeptidase M32 [Leptolinea sp.]|nr:carboxypeptidase M32 [Leptolinea sp.]